jgi:hypothetical protein
MGSRTCSSPATVTTCCTGTTATAPSPMSPPRPASVSRTCATARAARGLITTAMATWTSSSPTIARVETEALLSRISERDPARFQDLAQAALRKLNLLAAWRRQVDLFFQRTDPQLESRLYPPDAPRRLVVQLYSRDIAVQPEKLWGRFKTQGTRIPLNLHGVKNGDGYLRALFGGGAENHERSLLGRLRDEAGFAPRTAGSSNHTQRCTTWRSSRRLSAMPSRRWRRCR